MNPTKTIMIIMAALVLSACAANPKRVIFNDDSPTMAALLRTGANHPPLTYSNKPHSAQTALDHNGSVHPGENVFRELANPTLLLYIEPHRTPRGTFIPGMVVPYKLYPKVEYALPGEY